MINEEKSELNENNLNLDVELEGIIFIANEKGITIEQLISSTKTDLIEVSRALNKLKDKYLSNSHGYYLDINDNLCSFKLKDQVYPYLEKLYSKQMNYKLSPSALETLAIIAYKQPITKAEIEEIRTVSVYNMLNKLLNRKLIKTTMINDIVAYQVTDEFLKCFNLVSIEELPEIDAFNDKDSVKNLFNNETLI